MDRSAALDFLRTHLPASDLDCYPEELFQKFADHALMLRKNAPWCAALEEEIFAHYVLFPRVNDEDLSFHRKIFFDALWPRVRDLPTAEDRVLEVNRWCHEHASYQAQDDRTASPLTVFRCGSGRCGEESAFLVSALRSVGIPARQVYAPWWSHCDDNHAWVEALCGENWRFLGACEPEPILDRGWFNGAASRAMLVRSRIFGAGSSLLHGALLGREGAVCWYNQTERYTRTRLYTFRALRNGMPAAGAVFHLQVLNEACFRTIAVLTAGENGEASAELGLGDLHVLAVLDGLVAEGDCVDGTVTLHLTPPADVPLSQVEFDFHAPVGQSAPPAGLDSSQRESRSHVLQRGNSLREKRLASFFPTESSVPAWTDLLQEARGNAGELLTFLQGPGSADREKLLRTLSAKDLRDVSPAVLEDHFALLPPRAPEIPEEIYWSYVACPRVAREPLTAWRGQLRRWLSDWTGTPSALWQQLEDLPESPADSLYTNLYWPPASVLESGRCDAKSRDLLFIAALRTLGIPARLRPMDGAPEFWENGTFRLLQQEEQGTLSLVWDGTAQPLYYQNWTLSRRIPDGWQRLDIPDAGWAGNRRKLDLPAGYYRLMTAARLPNGNQFAARTDILLESGKLCDTALCLRPFNLSDMLYSRDLPPLSVRTLEGQSIPDFLQEGGRPKLLFWLEEGGEPTEHVLNELLAAQATLEAMPVEVVFLLRGQESLSQPTLAKTLARWPAIRVLLDDWAYDLEAVARLLALDPDTPPLAVACDSQGKAVYGFSGYRVGAVELLQRVAAL